MTDTDQKQTTLIAGIGATSPALEENAPWISFPFQSWLNPLMQLAAKRPLEFPDLFRLLPKYDSEPTVNRLAIKLAEALNEVGTKQLSHSDRVKLLRYRIFTACVKLYPLEMTLGFVFHMFSAITNATAPVVMNAFLLYLSNRDTYSLSWGYFLAFMFLVNQLFNAIGWNSSQYYMRGIAMSVRGAMSGLIYQKSLSMSTASRLKFSNGRVFNLIASDCQNLENFFRDVHALTCLPLQALGLAILAVVYMGLSGVIGMIFLVVAISFNSLMMGKIVKLERNALKATDDRVKTTSEVLNAIKIVKLFAWEKSFVSRIKGEREIELGFQKMIRLVNVVFSMLINILPTFTNLLIFGLFFVFGNSFTPATVFTALTIVNLIRLPVMFIPFCYQLAYTGWVSYERIAEFLLVPDRDNQPTSHDASESSGFAISIKNGKFVWPLVGSSDDDAEESTLVDGVEVPKQSPNNGTNQLQHVDLDIQKGSLTVVVGKVGAGKSSLFYAILGDMERTGGSVDIYGRIAYASQSAWLQSASIRENILFGAPFDESKYREVIKACALERDLTLFSDGDMSQIGEKGVTLSGGQAARVGLARAVYADRDILLLDDPLAAVDAHVGKHLLEECILKHCKGKTVILVTHQLHVTPHADNIVLIQDGLIAEQGTYDSLMAKQSLFAVMMQDHAGAASEGEAEKSESKKVAKVVVDEELKAKPVPVDEKGVQPQAAAKQLMTVEERAMGRVNAKYYFIYLNRAGGIFICSMILLCAFVWQTSKIVTDLWLTFWLSFQISNFSNQDYIYTYLGLAVAQAALLLVMSYAVAVSTIRAGRQLHNECLDSVLLAPMSFFETNPIGRIISRFSKDFAETDRQLPILIQQVLEMLLSLLGIVVLIAYAVPFCLIFVVVLVPLYIHFLKFFRASVRELKRLENLGRSPLYAHIAETLSGLSTIRSYQSVNAFVNLQNLLLDAGNQPIYVKSVAECWMSNRAEGFVALLIFVVAILGLVTNANPSLLGLALSYALSLMTLINMVLPRLADLEARMNSIERICHYITELPSERTASVAQVPASWPATGTMQFKNLSMKYRDDLDPVLHGITFDIQSGQKVGVVGRTGAGKSSVITAAFRIVEASEGEILLDGVDISHVGLDTLRGRLSIIPQAPILFDGTIRFNLDPMNDYSDEDLWHVLERCALKDYVSSQDQRLDAPVTEGGENLSVGQRQLLCLGRAMLRQSKVLFIDEATASVDIETDTYIQKVIREDFADATVICIAHRLGTLIDYDRILVLDAGRVKEFDTPHNLLGIPDSAFSSLVDETGAANAKMLRGLAEAAAKKTK